MNLKSYYNYYLTLHRNAKCRFLHFIGQLFTIIFLGVVIYYQKYILLFITPFIIYPFAWSGHYFFEKNKPAAFSNPLYAKISDWIMFKDVLLGRIKIW
tara:strand:- start:358 stop:651 length:294 start_codon:yes stop_codon:yes gene_type:complete